MKNSLLLCFLFSIASAFSQSNEEKYQNSIRIADSCFAAKDYTKAKRNYEISLQYKPMEVYPNHKIAEVQAHEEKELEIKRLYHKADSCFVAKDFIQAKEHYMHIVTIKPFEENAKYRIAEIEKTLHDTKEAVGKKK